MHEKLRAGYPNVIYCVDAVEKKANSKRIKLSKQNCTKCKISINSFWTPALVGHLLTFDISLSFANFS